MDTLYNYVKIVTFKIIISVIIAGIIHFIFKYYNINTDILKFKYDYGIVVLTFLILLSFSVTNFIKNTKKQLSEGRRTPKLLLILVILFIYASYHILNDKEIPSENKPDALFVFLFCLAFLSIIHLFIKLIIAFIGKIRGANR